MAVAHRGCVVAGCLLLLLLAGCEGRRHTLTLNVRQQESQCYHSPTANVCSYAVEFLHTAKFKLASMIELASTDEEPNSCLALVTVRIGCSKEQMKRSNGRRRLKNVTDNKRRVSYSVTCSSQNETRYAVELNNFGFFANGTLDVNLASLHLSNESLDYTAHPVSIRVRRAA